MADISCKCLPYTAVAPSNATALLSCYSNNPIKHGLFCSVKECHNLTACAVIIDHELSTVRAGCIAGRYFFLGTPEDGFIEHMIRRDILER